MMPFMSKYKLSSSQPFGFGRVQSTGISSFVAGSISGSSSATGVVILGYFCESHRKSAGTLGGGKRLGYED